MRARARIRGFHKSDPFFVCDVDDVEEPDEDGSELQALMRAHDGTVFRLPQRTFVPLVLALGRHDLGEVHALELRLQEQAGHLDRRLADVEASIAVDLKTLNEQDQVLGHLRSSHIPDRRPIDASIILTK